MLKFWGHNKVNKFIWSNQLLVLLKHIFFPIFTCRQGNETEVENAVQGVVEGVDATIISAFSSIDWSEETVQEFIKGIESADIYQACYASTPVRNYTISTAGADFVQFLTIFVHIFYRILMPMVILYILKSSQVLAAHTTLPISVLATNLSPAVTDWDRRTPCLHLPLPKVNFEEWEHTFTKITFNEQVKASARCHYVGQVYRVVFIFNEVWT